jgi:hypothetical protein
MQDSNLSSGYHARYCADSSSVVAEIEDNFELRIQRTPNTLERWVLSCNIWCTRLNDFRTILIDPPEEVSELLQEIQSSFMTFAVVIDPWVSNPDEIEMDSYN